ncbi:MAG: FMN-binding protein [Oscillospiraceae bacterium]|nr:FMN-binding protein [Oscillospiraceae bacterium]
MKNNNIVRTALCLVLLLALMLLGAWGVNAWTGPIIEANEKALLGDAVLIYDAAAPAESALTVASGSVQKIYRDDTKQLFTVDLSTSEGYSHGPIELKLIVDFEGKIADLQLVQNSDDKDFGTAFIPSFVGQDSALGGVDLVAGVTFSTSAIRNAVSGGMNALIDNGLITAGQKSAEQLLTELVSTVYPGIVNKAGAIQGDELPGLGLVTKGYKAANDSGFACFIQDGENAYLGVITVVGGAAVYDLEGNPVSEPALLDAVTAFAATSSYDLDADQQAALARLLPEGAELEPVQVPGLAGTVTGVYRVDTADGVLYAFAARPYGYSNEVMELWYVLDENGAIVSMRAKELILYSEYFSNYTLNEASYKEGFIGLTADGYTGEQALISGATMSSDAVDTATRDVFEAFGLLNGN